MSYLPSTQRGVRVLYGWSSSSCPAVAGCSTGRPLCSIYIACSALLLEVCGLYYLIIVKDVASLLFHYIPHLGHIVSLVNIQVHLLKMPGMKIMRSIAGIKLPISSPDRVDVIEMCMDLIALTDLLLWQQKIIAYSSTICLRTLKFQRVSNNIQEILYLLLVTAFQELPFVMETPKIKDSSVPQEEIYHDRTPNSQQRMSAAVSQELPPLGLKGHHSEQLTSNGDKPQASVHCIG
ncbi:hypothetical protein GUJ93_ZPchr0009g799 [Zizania palustris]|uniref:Uncharacterized protein n=1 Tax=Zizania palustris TaxID=103762 RepID=A0A8J5RC76_ZIZPA|nr:hypothetical protein GUJ93_ZPchr0009g799 [Zizania palustris]